MYEVKKDITRKVASNIINGKIKNEDEYRVAEIKIDEIYNDQGKADLVTMPS